MLFLSLTARLAIVAIALVAASTLVGTLSWIEHRDRFARTSKKSAHQPRRQAPLPKAA